MPAAARRTALVAHVGTSVGWLGAVAAFLGLALVTFSTDDPATVRALTVAMEVLGWAVLVPLAVASFATGLIQSLGTGWGLFRHYWVIAKLSLSLVVTGVLLLYTPTLALLADAARSTTASEDHLLPSTSPLLHSAAALVVLVTATALSVFKPKGLTPYGWRRLQRPGALSAPAAPP